MDEEEQYDGCEECGETVEIEMNVFGQGAAIQFAQFEALLMHGFRPDYALYLVASASGGELKAPM